MSNKRQAELTAAKEMAQAYADSFAGYAPLPALSAWLGKQTAQAKDTFVKLGFPTTRTEEWCFTNIAPLARQAFHAPQKQAVNGAVISEAKLVKDAVTLVFIDGRLNYDLSEITNLPNGVTIAPLSQGAGLLDDAKKAKILNTTASLEAANTAFLTDGYILIVADGVTVKTPIELVFVGTGNQSASHIRNFISVGKNSKLELFETWTSSNNPDNIYWHNSVCDIILADGSKLAFTRQQSEALQAFHTATVKTTVGKDATFTGFIANLGSKIARTEWQTTLNNSGSRVELYGFSLVGKGQHHNVTTHTNHTAPNTSADQLFRNVVADSGHGVFMGKYHVLPVAQQTDAAMLNQNLLLGKKAKADSKPELEIYADDVKCSHGATCGSLDEGALFYLRSRGIDEMAAKAMLTEGFIDDLILKIDNAQAKELLHSRIHRWLQTTKRVG